MNAATLPCPTCACTGEDTHEDRHAGTNQDTCRTCSGTGFIPARTGETAEASFRLVTPQLPDLRSIREALFRMKTECEIEGLDQKPGFDAWVAWANQLLGVSKGQRLPPLPELARVRHLKRGSEYEVLGEAEAQVSDTRSGVDTRKARMIADGHMLTVYRGEDGKLWCRFTDEFRDGRFAPVNATPAQEVSR